MSNQNDQVGLSGAMPWYWTWKLPLVLAMAATVACVVFVMATTTHFQSPDETANLAFARQVASTGTARIIEPLNLQAEGIIRPRSFRLNGDVLTPGSFVGFPYILGWLGRMTDSGLIPYWPIVFSSLSILAVWYIIARLWSVRLAVMGVAVYCASPVFWFYALRPLWHNGFQTWLVLIAFALLIYHARHPHAWRLLLAVTAACLAIIVRPTEGVWLAPLFFLWWFLNKARPIRHWSAVFVPAVAMVGAVLWLQQITYGDPFDFSYNPQGLASIAGTTSSQLTEASTSTVSWLLSQATAAISRWWWFGVTLLAPFLLFGLFGIWETIRQRAKSSLAFRLAWATVIVNVWLLFFYGSFHIRESFDLFAPTLGSSYIRYWLPGLALLTLFIPYGIAQFQRRVSRTWGITMVLLIIFTLAGPIPLLFDRYYGVQKVVTRDVHFGRLLRQQVVVATEPSAIIFAGPNDKNLFPERRVVGYNRLTEREWRVMPSLVNQGEMIYLVSASGVSLVPLQQFLMTHSLKLELVAEVPVETSLYQIIREPEAVTL